MTLAIAPVNFSPLAAAYTDPMSASHDQERRRRNLAAELERLPVVKGKQAKLADALGVDASYISQLLNGHRQFGEKTARSMEDKLGWPAGYLDRADPDSKAIPPLLGANAKLTHALAILAKLLEPLSADSRNAVGLVLYQWAKEPHDAGNNAAMIARMVAPPAADEIVAASYGKPREVRVKSPPPPHTAPPHGKERVR